MRRFEVHVVFVGGYARTGSTLTDRLLGQIDGFASFGELRHIWERCFIGNQLCGCRRPFRECPFWTEVAATAFGGFDGVDAVALSDLARSVDSFWNIPRLAGRGWPRRFCGRLAVYRDAVAALYTAMQRVSGARFLVDSTKDPQHAYLLRSIPGFDVRVVHLVRDSRAVAFSWTRAKPRPEIHWREQDMPRYPILRSALAWDLANLAAGATRAGWHAYALVRYEDLVCDAGAEVRRIVDELGLGPADLGFLDGRSATLGPAHTVAGNPIRFDDGPVLLRRDDRWLSEMRTSDRAVVTALTAPGLRAYGYPLRPRTSPGSDVPGGTVAGAAPASPGPFEMARILRLAARHRRDPMPYARSVAELSMRYLRNRGVAVRGRWLDVGTGNGVLPLAVREAGASSCIGLDLSDRRIPGAERLPFVAGDAERLPFADGTFDGVVSSNVLEHTPDAIEAIRELIRVCAPGGFVYLSWTNWYSPLGGHEWSPFHYLGPRLGPRVYERLRGAPPPLNVPGRTLFPVHVGPVLRAVRSMDVRILDIAPRYWPSLRFLARVPGVRDVAMWNCVVLMRRPPTAARG